MTKDEFIRGYVERSQLEGATVTADGFTTSGGWNCVALPCSCPEEECDGWAMVPNNPISVAGHMAVYARKHDEA